MCWKVLSPISIPRMVNREQPRTLVVVEETLTGVRERSRDQSRAPVKQEDLLSSPSIQIQIQIQIKIQMMQIQMRRCRYRYRDMQRWKCSLIKSNVSKSIHFWKWNYPEIILTRGQETDTDATEDTGADTDTYTPTNPYSYTHSYINCLYYPSLSVCIEK